MGNSVLINVPGSFKTPAAKKTTKGRKSHVLTGTEFSQSAENLLTASCSKR